MNKVLIVALIAVAGGAIYKFGHNRPDADRFVKAMVAVNCETNAYRKLLAQDQAIRGMQLKARKIKQPKVKDGLNIALNQLEAMKAYLVTAKPILDREKVTRAELVELASQGSERRSEVKRRTSAAVSAACAGKTVNAEVVGAGVDIILEAARRKKI